MTLKGLLLLAGASGFVRNMNVAADGQFSTVETQADADVAVRREGQTAHEELAVWPSAKAVTGLPFHQRLDYDHLPADGWSLLPKGTPLVHRAYRHAPGNSGIPHGMRETPVQKMKMMVHFKCLERFNTGETFFGGDIRTPEGAKHLWKTWNDMTVGSIKPYAGHYENDDYQITFERRSITTVRPNGQNVYRLDNIFSCGNLQYDIHVAVHLDQEDLDRAVADRKARLTDRSEDPYTAQEVEIALAALDQQSQHEYGRAEKAAKQHMKRKDAEYARARRQHMKDQVVSAFSKDRVAGPAPKRSRGGDMDVHLGPDLDATGSLERIPNLKPGRPSEQEGFNLDLEGMMERKRQKVQQLIAAGIMKKFEDVTVFDEITKWKNHKVGDKYGGVFWLGHGAAKNVQGLGVNQEQTYAFHFTQTCERDESRYKWEESAELLNCAKGKKGTVLLTGAPGLGGWETGYFIGSRFVLYQQK